MSERASGARIGLGVELRATPPGALRHRAGADHHISVHAGAPVRVACHAGRVRSVRTRGEISLVPAGAAEDWLEDDASTSIELRLPASLVRGVAEDLGLDPDRAGLAPRFHFRDPQIEHLAWALDAERRAGFPNGVLYLESVGTALAVHLLSRYRAPVETRAELPRPQLRRIVEHIEAHLDEDLSLARLSRVAGVSASHLKVLFKRTTGLPVHAYVIQRRVERARALLAAGELPAAEVALAAGFAHQSHMARCMRRVLGVTPRAIARSRST
jgi:AraC family transcriptional regulator